MSLDGNLREELKCLINKAISLENRANQGKPVRYWYPLSMATYGADEILESLDSMCAFRTSMWEKTLDFERRFSTYLGCFDSVMVNSGSSADLLMAYLLTNPRRPHLKAGDEILIPIVTWPTHVWSAMMAGLRVTFVDVDPETCNVDLDDLERKITSRTKAIFLVHLLGNPCDMLKINKIAEAHNLLILEDCCEALGADFNGKKVGTFGLVGSFSFFFSHHITTMEGGMISCNNSATVDELKILRAHGWSRNASRPVTEELEPGIDPRYAFVNWGFNVRPTDINAAFGLHQLKKLTEFNSRRDKIFERFKSHVTGKGMPIRFPAVHEKATPSWLAIPMIVNSNSGEVRKRFCDYLELNGVETRPIVAGNLSRHPVAKLFPELARGEFEGANQVHDNGLYIGLSPMASDALIDRLLEVIDGFEW
jgi:CDP-6-deoxy-D-xylo-4-hexulose-3-dehydrase